MPIVGVKICGARCRTKGGAPCCQPGMKNGRCKMHGGVFSRLEKHGRQTLRAKSDRKKERALLRELQQLNTDLEQIVDG